MNDTKLTPAEEAELKFLRQQVDDWFNDTLLQTPPPNANNNLHYARDALRSFVSNLRKKGRTI